MLQRRVSISTSILSIILRVPLAVMFCVLILRSCGVLLCVVSTLSGQCVVPVKCMSLIMYYVRIIKYSVFNDLELVLGLALHKKHQIVVVNC